jgi:hypothetical protein
MPDHTVVAGETWDSMAETFGVPTSWLLLCNGYDPNDPPDPPEEGSTVKVAAEPPDHAIAPGNDHSLDLGDGGLDQVRIRLHDASAAPMSNVRYTVHHAGGDDTGVSDDGWITVVVPSGLCESIDVEWGAEDDDSEHPYRLSVMTGCSEDTDSDWAAARLNNLGYDTSQGLEAAARSFQADYGLDDAGLADDGSLLSQTASALSQIFDDDCDASRQDP